LRRGPFADAATAGGRGASASLSARGYVTIGRSLRRVIPDAGNRKFLEYGAFSRIDEHLRW